MVVCSFQSLLGQESSTERYQVSRERCLVLRRSSLGLYLDHGFRDPIQPLKGSRTSAADLTESSCSSFICSSEMSAMRLPPAGPDPLGRPSSGVAGGDERKGF